MVTGPGRTRGFKSVKSYKPSENYPLNLLNDDDRIRTPVKYREPSTQNSQEPNQILSNHQATSDHNTSWQSYAKNFFQKEFLLATNYREHITLTKTQHVNRDDFTRKVADCLKTARAIVAISHEILARILQPDI